MQKGIFWHNTRLQIKLESVMGHLNTNNFIFLLFYFYFGQWRGMWHHSHMTCHMMWHHRPRTWWKNLEDDIRAYVYNMVVLSREWGEHEVVEWTKHVLYIKDSNLVETSCWVLLCFSPLDCLTESFTACVIIGPCV